MSFNPTLAAAIKAEDQPYAPSDSVWPDFLPGIPPAILLDAVWTTILKPYDVCQACACIICSLL